MFEDFVNESLITEAVGFQIGELEFPRGGWDNFDPSWQADSKAVKHVKRQQKYLEEFEGIMKKYGKFKYFYAPYFGAVYTKGTYFNFITFPKDSDFNIMPWTKEGGRGDWKGYLDSNGDVFHTSGSKILDFRLDVNQKGYTPTIFDEVYLTLILENSNYNPKAKSFMTRNVKQFELNFKTPAAFKRAIKNNIIELSNSKPKKGK